MKRSWKRRWTRSLRHALRSEDRFRGPRRLGAESLERRALLTTFYVDGDAGDTIQDAIDAAAASPGADTVVIAPGVYNEQLEIEDPDSLTLKGNGATIDSQGVDGHVIEIDDSGHVVIEDLTVTGGEGDGINADTLQSLTLKNVSATNNDDGIQVESAQSLSMHGVTATGNADEGAAIEDVETVKVVGGNYSQNGDEGAAIEDVETVKVVGGNYSQNGGDGLQLTDTPTVFISGGTFSNNDDGIDIEVDDGVLNSVKVYNATAEQNDDEGLEVDGASFIRVLGGQYNDNAEAGLDIDDSKVIQIHRVQASGNGEHGLQITAGDDGLENSVTHSVLVIDSVFDGNTGDGINIRSDADTSFVDKVHLARVRASNNTESGLDIEANSVKLALVTSGTSAGNGEDDIL